VRGPLNVARSVQGRPVLVQAGASDTGRDVAAQLPRHGRSADVVCIMPGLYPVVGRTQAEAEDKFAQLQSLIHPLVGPAVLGATFVVDVSGHDLDGPVPDMPVTNGPRSRQALLLEAARRDNLTPKELAELNAGLRGHLLICGTPGQIADVMEHWFRAGAADGFNVMPAWLPGPLTDFVDAVVPELQRRGLFRTAYAGHTLRGHLGLPHPVTPRDRSDVAAAGGS
jgi:alkanesulfonate monooxygenase SsuD/methylene tetrahydromethanopterin reductase-like flavin-dependent oxidoreductase (luciferase family)